jgi:hypothetical protein
MAGFGDSVEDAVMNVVFRGVPYPFLAADRLSLHTADPTDAGLFEVAGAGYARQVGVWGASSGGVVSLVGDLDFNNMPACTVTHFGVWTGTGQFVGSGPAANETLLVGDSYRLQAGTTATIT